MNPSPFLSASENISSHSSSVKVAPYLNLTQTHTNQTFKTFLTYFLREIIFVLPRHCLFQLLLGYAPVVVVVESPGIRDNKRNLGYRIQIFFFSLQSHGNLEWVQDRLFFPSPPSVISFLLPPVISHVLLPLLLFFPHPIVLLLSPGRKTEDTWFPLTEETGKRGSSRLGNSNNRPLCFPSLVRRGLFPTHVRQIWEIPSGAMP